MLLLCSQRRGEPWDWRHSQKQRDSHWKVWCTWVWQWYNPCSVYRLNRLPIIYLPVSYTCVCTVKDSAYVHVHVHVHVYAVHLQFLTIFTESPHQCTHTHVYTSQSNMWTCMGLLCVCAHDNTFSIKRGKLLLHSQCVCDGLVTLFCCQGTSDLITVNIQLVHC